MADGKPAVRSPGPIRWQDVIELTTLGDKNSDKYQTTIADLNALEALNTGQALFRELLAAQARIPEDYKWSAQDEAREAPKRFEARTPKFNTNFWLPRLLKNPEYYAELSKVFGARTENKKIQMLVPDPKHLPHLSNLARYGGGGAAYDHAFLVIMDVDAISDSYPLQHRDGRKISGTPLSPALIGHELQHALDFIHAKFTPPRGKAPDLAPPCIEARAVTVEQAITRELLPDGPVRYAYMDAEAYANRIKQKTMDPRTYVNHRENIRQSLWMNSGCAVVESADPAATKEAIISGIKSEASNILLQHGITITPDAARQPATSAPKPTRTDQGAAKSR